MIYDMHGGVSLVSVWAKSELESEVYEGTLGPEEDVACGIACGAAACLGSSHGNSSSDESSLSGGLTGICLIRWYHILKLSNLRTR